MQRLVYILSYPFLWIIASLPFKWFYFFSDLVYFLLYRVIGYRKKVVRENLNLAFPDFSREQLLSIEKKFYRHMCDVFLEAIKTMRIEKEELKKRYKLNNLDMLLELEEKNSIIILAPHYGNWEWSTVITDDLRSRGYAVYQKIGNKYFDAMIKKIRAKWNSTLIHQKEMVRTIVRNQKQNTRAVYGIAMDQSPQLHRTKYWRPFMGITVPVFDNPENLARKYDLTVLFAKNRKVKRGFYETEFVHITDRGSTTQLHEITDRFIELTEDCIREEPAHYLWTHRRWKHRDKVPEEFKV